MNIMQLENSGPYRASLRRLRDGGIIYHHPCIKCGKPAHFGFKPPQEFKSKPGSWKDVFWLCYEHKNLSEGVESSEHPNNSL